MKVRCYQRTFFISKLKIVNLNLRNKINCIILITMVDLCAVPVKLFVFVLIDS